MFATGSFFVVITLKQALKELNVKPLISQFLHAYHQLLHYYVKLYMLHSLISTMILETY